MRPVPYTIPDDGPVGAMLAATGRHPWRPAHIHLIVRAEGYAPVTTHVFDRESAYLDSDAVFAVKPSLLRDFVPRPADDPERPAGVEGRWFSVRNDIVLAPSGARRATARSCFRERASRRRRRRQAAFRDLLVAEAIPLPRNRRSRQVRNRRSRKSSIERRSSEPGGAAA